METLEARTTDGVRLALRRFAPAGEARGTVLAMHAMWASGSYFDRPSGRGFASHLAGQGLDTFVLDFRGHGGSGRPARGWTLDEYVTLDLPATLGRMEEATGRPRSTFVWVGHSLGGLVSVAAAGRDPTLAPRRLVLVTTNIWRRVGLARRIVTELFDGTARFVGHMPVRRLRLGTDDEPRAYVAQLARWVRTGRFTSADGRVDYDETLACVRAPVLMVVGGADLLCREEHARELGERLGSRERELIVVSRARGYGLDAKHFSVLTDRRAVPLWDEMARWILVG